MPQEAIADLLIARARSGCSVVRLKGGDPFVFGRGGEEALALTRAGVPWEVVPGVTSAVAVPAYAGIPLTHRDLAASFAVVSGHRARDRQGLAVDLRRVAQAVDTLVVLMGLSTVEAVTADLLAGGRGVDEPSCAIAWGTTPRQRTVVAPLGRLAQEVREAGLTSPTLLIVGRVVRLRSALAWFESRPLFGRRILVTRSREQSSSLSDRIRELGGEPVELPTIAVVPPLDWSPVDEALASLAKGEYAWVCFTSQHAVAFFLQRLWELGGDARRLAGASVAAVGQATAEPLAAAGIRADLIPEEGTAEGLVAALAERVSPGMRVLFPRGQLARPALRSGLERLGCRVDDPVTYRTIPDPEAAAAADRLLEGPGVDAVTFASPSAVDNFVAALGRRAAEIGQRAKVACIGPTTAEATRRAGLPVHTVADEPSAAALADALCRLWQPKS